MKLNASMVRSGVVLIRKTMNGLKVLHIYEIVIAVGYTTMYLSDP